MPAVYEVLESGFIGIGSDWLHSLGSRFPTTSITGAHQPRLKRLLGTYITVLLAMSAPHQACDANSTRRDGSTRRAIDILDAVCRRVKGKTAVSHVFLRLFAGSSLHPHLARIRARLGITLTVYNSMGGCGVRRPRAAEGTAREECCRDGGWPARFSLPPQIHRDRPVIRHGRN